MRAAHEGLLAVYSLSKQSNLAGYRAAFVEATRRSSAAPRGAQARRHDGPRPGPARDDGRPARRHPRRCAASGIRPHAGASARGGGPGRPAGRPLRGGLYIWATREEDCWTTVSELADRGILVAPGAFYGAAGRQHVRIALTATDERSHRRGLRPAREGAGTGTTACPGRGFWTRGTRAGVTSHADTSGVPGRTDRRRVNSDERSGRDAQGRRQGTHLPGVDAVVGNNGLGVGRPAQGDRPRHLRRRLRQHRVVQERDHLHRR